MNKFVFIAFLWVNCALAQVSNQSIISVSTAPSGSCSAGLPNRQVISTGAQYSCQNGTWGEIGGDGGGATTPATNLLLKGNGSTNGVVSANPSIDYAIPAYLNPANAQNNDIAKMYNQVISDNHFNFSCDNSDGWHAGSNYSAYGMFMMDVVWAVEAYPSYFTPNQVKNVVLKANGARNANGEFPFAVANDCLASDSTYYSGWDQAHIYAVPEGATGSAFLADMYYHETGDTSLYASVVANIKTALAIIPRNPTTHLITVSPTAQYVPATGYMESMRSTGDNAAANVSYFYAMEALHEMAVAAGDSTNATFFASEASTVQSSIISTLVDSTTQLLKWDTGQLAGNLDLYSSAWSCYTFSKQTPLLGGTQCAAIANYLDTNSSTISYDGFFTYSPTPFAVIGIIPSGGSGTGGTFPNQGAGQYQNNGFWQWGAGWIMNLINQVNPAKIPSLLTSYWSGPNPGVEYFDTGTPPILGVSASPTLISSGSGSKIISDIHPAPLQSGPGNCVLNLYGICTSTTSSSFTALTLPGPVGSNCDILCITAGENQGVTLNGGSTYTTVNLKSDSENYQFSTGGSQAFGSLANSFYVDHHTPPSTDSIDFIVCSNDFVGAGTGINTCPASLFSVGVGSPFQVNANGTVSAPHYAGSGTTPTVVVGAAAGSGATAVVDANAHDSSGFITITLGSSPSSGVLVTLTFGSTWATEPHCVISNGSSDAALNSSIIFNVQSTTTATFTSSGPSTGTTLGYNYICQQ